MITRPRTSIPLCRSFARNSNLLARWCVQTESWCFTWWKLQIWAVVILRFGYNSGCSQGLITTRQWLKNELFDRCAGAGSLSESETLKIGNFETLIESPMSWRLKEAIRLLASKCRVNLPLPMTNFCVSVNSFPQVLRVLSAWQLPQPSTDHLLTHFFLINGNWGFGHHFRGWKRWNQRDKFGLSVPSDVLFLLLGLKPNLPMDALSISFLLQSPCWSLQFQWNCSWFRELKISNHPRSRSTYPQFRTWIWCPREVKTVFDNPIEGKSCLLKRKVRTLKCWQS